MGDDPSKKARDADRDGAIEVVEAAFADGQLTGADRELRVERLLQARTLGDVDMLVRDLQRPAAGPGVTRPSVSAPPPARSAQPASPGVNLKKVLVVLAVVVGVFTVLSAVVPLLVLSSVDEVTSSGPAVEVSEAAAVAVLTTAAGYDDLTAAVERNTGTTTVFSATLYPEYAAVEVPVDRRSQRATSHYYDGRWQDGIDEGPAEEGRFDLTSIEGATVQRVVRQARRQLANATSAYVVVNPLGRGPGVCLSAYASNRAGETAYVDARCDGTIVSAQQ